MVKTLKKSEWGVTDNGREISKKPHHQHHQHQLKASDIARIMNSILGRRINFIPGRRKEKQLKYNHKNGTKNGHNIDTHDHDNNDNHDNEDDSDDNGRNSGSDDDDGDNNGNGIHDNYEKKQHSNRQSGNNLKKTSGNVVIDEDRSLMEPPYQLYPLEKVVTSIEWKQITRIHQGSGLNNLGNTCFMNAALQCLLYTAPLIHYLLNERKSITSSSSSSLSNHYMNKFNALDEMTKLTKLMHVSKNHGSISPNAIANNLKSIGRFRLGRQEDSHEFIIQLLDKMEQELLRPYMSSYGSGGMRQSKLMIDKNVAKTNVINQIFGGYLRSQIKTSSTNYISNTYDPFMDLSLQLTQGVTSIETALNKYITPDILDGSNKYKCPITKKYVKASKQLTISRAPPILMIHLKRFNEVGRKIVKHVRYNEFLDLAPYMSDFEEKEQVIYSLYAVLVHTGNSCHSGHYFSFIKASNNIWYEMNDSSVRQVSLQNKVLNQNAYILFYKRQYDENELRKMISQSNQSKNDDKHRHNNNNNINNTNNNMNRN